MRKFTNHLKSLEERFENDINKRKLISDYTSKVNDLKKDFNRRDPRKSPFRYSGYFSIDPYSELYKSTFEKVIKISQKLHLQKASLNNGKIGNIEADTHNAVVAYILNKKYNLPTCILADDRDFLQLALSVEDNCGELEFMRREESARLVFSPTGYSTVILNPNKYN